MGGDRQDLEGGAFSAYRSKFVPHPGAAKKKGGPTAFKKNNGLARENTTWDLI